MTLSRRIVAETLGTAFLLAAVVGSGIMGEKLAGGNVALALLANTLATGYFALAAEPEDLFPLISEEKAFTRKRKASCGPAQV